MIVLHEATGTIRVVMDRCMKWTCDDCWRRKLGQKTEHLLLLDHEVVLTEDGTPRLDKRAIKVKAGYMKVFVHGRRLPFIMAEPQLFPGEDTIEVLAGLRSLSLTIKANRCKMICFNGKWQFSRDPEHLFLGRAWGMTYLETVQAIEDAGFEDMNSGGTDPEVVRRLIGHRLDCIDFP